MKRYQKVCVVFTALMFSVSYPTSAYGVSKSQKVTDAFESYLERVNTTYDAEMTSAVSTYEPQIKVSQNKLLAAQSQFLNVNQVTILKTTSYSSNPPVAIDAVNCPTTRPDCKSVMKSNEFIAGEITNIYNFVGGVEAFTKSSFIQMNTGMLQTLDSQIKDGLIKLNNPSGYTDAVTTIRFETSNFESLNKQYQSAKYSITSKRDTGLLVESALLAAQRAAKSPSNYDKAFVAALKFEQNRVKLNELASTPWRYINSYKALSSALSVTRFSDQADTVADNYSYSRALSINSSCGTTFTNDSSFKSLFGLIATIYKQATKVTIKL